MNITLDIPQEVEAAVKAIPDLDIRLLSFIHGQLAYEQQRKQASPATQKAWKLIQAGRQLAQQDAAAGISREQAFDGLIAVHTKITERL